MIDSFSSVWVHSVHFAKFPMIRFAQSHRNVPTILLQFQPNFIIDMLATENIIFGDLSIIKIVMVL